MRIVIINKSDTTGGAAVVSFRLMEALRLAGVDARMLVTEKLSDSPYVENCAGKFRILFHFITERLKIFIDNGFNRKTLFKIDTGSSGLPLWKHPLVKEADAILINWINQGVLSLRGIAKISALGKPVIWTMHDMWCMTGICHHAGTCTRYKASCGLCPLLDKKASSDDISHSIWETKNKTYGALPVFVAVSSWLFNKSKESSLLKDRPVYQIGNAFKLDDEDNHILRRRLESGENAGKDKLRILLGAARLDDPIKGLDTLKELSKVLKSEYPAISGKIEIILFGNIKNPEALEGFSLPVRWLGILNREQSRKAYEEADVVVSASSYETLPGTLVEAQAFGCIPVSFNQGGQPDIIDHLSTGYLAEYDPDINSRAKNLAQGVIWAESVLRNPAAHEGMIERMRENVKKKFSYQRIAQEYISLIRNLERD